VRRYLHPALEAQIVSDSSLVTSRDLSIFTGAPTAENVDACSAFSLTWPSYLGRADGLFCQMRTMCGPPNCKKKASCNKIRRGDERTVEIASAQIRNACAAGVTSKAAGAYGKISFPLVITILAFISLTYPQTISRPPAAAQKQANSGTKREGGGSDPLLDLPSLPTGETTVVGGTVSKIDPITDRLELRYFGGGKIDISFDPRTKILNNGSPATAKDIHPGSQVYVDTMLKGDQVFARSIRVQTVRLEGEARGQVVAVDARRGVLKLREEVAPQIFQFRLGPQTIIIVEGRVSKASDVLPGALVSIKFPGGGLGSSAYEVRVLANPGESFTFVGEITYLDVHVRRMAIANRSDKENYDITLDKIAEGQLHVMKIGSHVALTAIFNGNNYDAQSVDVVAPHNQADE
jgi:hypothetical protein